MIHECNVNCRTIDVLTVESLGISDPGKWLPFFIDLDQVYAAKLTTDDDDDITFGCTTIFCYDGEVFVIDTPYDKFKKVFINYKKK